MQDFGRMQNRRGKNYFRLQPSGKMQVFLHFYIHRTILYGKDTEPFISCFHVLTSNTSFQYLSIHAMSFIACYSYMLSIYLIGINHVNIKFLDFTLNEL